ncbi:hypothetical protein C2I19_16230 [Chromobacterium alticapitis]|uniref:Uncharacterized protein n=2 Tax=Chromobacterium alticapitis TaxID=2073169 RepID=A0A2S5DCX6_9NEIS|nr:hypothetical protein C2I19_16230 [Chromobacterium alticapitis]
MTLGKGFVIYVALLVVQMMLLLLTVKFDWFPGVTLPFTYIGCGFLLNRLVLRGLIEWHPVYDTLQNVSSEKLGMLLVWPFRYPALFFQLLVHRHL